MHSFKFSLTSRKYPFVLLLSICFQLSNFQLIWCGFRNSTDHQNFDWLIEYLRFYVPPKNISPIWRRHHYWWRAAKFRPMLGAQGLWAGRDPYHTTPAVTWDLGFSGLIRRTASFICLLRQMRGCGGSTLTRILTNLKILKWIHCNDFKIFWKFQKKKTIFPFYEVTDEKQGH
jgi:hypothetical protein